MPPDVPRDRAVQDAIAQATRHMQIGVPGAAIEVLEAVCRTHPGDPALRYRWCEAMVAGGRPDDAIRELKALMNDDGAQPQPLRLLAALLFGRGRFEESMQVFARLAVLRPKSPEPRVGAARSLIESGHPDEALVYLGALDESLRQHPTIQLTAAQAHLRAGDYEAARATLERLSRGAGPSAEVWSTLARVYERLRDSDAARHAATHAISLESNNEVAGRLLARLDRAEGRLDSAIERLESLRQLNLSDEARAHVCMELGQVLDEVGEYERAFALFEEGHRRFDRANPMLATQFNDFLGRLRRAAEVREASDPRSWPENPPDDGLSSPVFLIGAPRSGTTLFERILGGLPGILTSDEAPMLVETINHGFALRGVRDGDIQASMEGLSESEVRSLRAYYWERATRHVGADSHGGATLVDKHPINTGYLIAVRRLFPDAKVICVIRDPRDVVLSMYMQDLLPGRGMLHYRSLEQAADAYARLMGVYLRDKARLGLAVCETRYEDLLNDFDRTARPLVEFLGRTWDDSLLRFSDRASKRRSGVNPYTTSRSLFSTSMARWRRYESPMRAVENALAPFVHIFGYDDHPA